MGFFTTKKLFSSTRALRNALYSIKSLDAAQRERIFDALESQFDAGGITSFEFKETIKKLHAENEISDQDYSGLLTLVD